MGDSSQIIVTGYLAGDPEMRYTDQGTERTVFSIATHRKYNDVEETTWHRITVWGKQADACNNWLRKGSIVQVTGRLNPDPETGGPRIWHTDEGEARASFEIVARDVTFLAELRESQRQEMGGAQADPFGDEDVDW